MTANSTGSLERVAQLEGLYWHYVPSRKEILHLYPGGGGARKGGVLKAFSLTEGKDRVVATIDWLRQELAVSPDGKRIAYTTARLLDGPSPNQYVFELAVMSINGEPEATLIPAQPERLMARAWSPDGKYLLFHHLKEGPKVMNVETRESWVLHPDAAGRGTDPWGLAWSPDGSFVLIDKSSSSSERLAWQGVTAEAVARLMEGR